MQKIALEILETCNIEIRDRLSNIERRIQQRHPGFKSKPLHKDFMRVNKSIVIEELPVEDEYEADEYSIKILSQPSNKDSSQHDKSCSSLLNVLRETDAKSRRLRHDIKTIVKKIGCSDESRSIGSYVIRLVPPLDQDRINEVKADFKSPRSDRIHRHRRTNSDEKQSTFAFPKNTLQIPQASILDCKQQQLDGTHILDSERLIQKDEGECDNFLSRSDLADSAGSLSLIQNISQRQLDIQSANQYTQEYIQKLKQRLEQQQIPRKIKFTTFEKFIKRTMLNNSEVEKRAQLATATSVQDQQIRQSPRKKSIHNIQSALDVQYTVRDKALRKMLEMRDSRYK